MGGSARHRHRAPRKPVRRSLVVLALAVAIVALAVAGTLFAVSERLGDDVIRVPDPFAALDSATRPAPTAAMTFLLVGTDSRSGRADHRRGRRGKAFVQGAQRSDVVMLAQVSADRWSASVSIPRDEIPGRGRAKVNAAYSWGGPALLVATVERLTGVRVDHFAVIDFAGFRSVVDAIGGVDVGVSVPTSSAGVAFQSGVNHLDGAAALAYVRQRHELAGGGLARAARQQNVLRAVLGKLVDVDLLTRFAFLAALTRSMSVDETLTNAGLRVMAFAVRPQQVVFLTAPVRGGGTEGGQSVVLLDDARGASLWAGLRDGTSTIYAQQHPDALLGPTPAGEEHR
jgi:LCP family protein required for cell wall assembly